MNIDALFRKQMMYTAITTVLLWAASGIAPAFAGSEQREGGVHSENRDDDRMLRPNGGENRVSVQSGEVAARSAVVWGRCNREQPARLQVQLFESGEEYERGKGRVVEETQVTDETDFTGSVMFRGLKPDTDYAYRVWCLPQQGTRQNHSNKKMVDRSAIGSFKTAPGRRNAETVRFVWAADLAGQGWGRNPDLSIVDTWGETLTGGYVIFDVMRKLEPDFAVFAGDIIYADNPIPPVKEIPLEVGGGIWVNDPIKDFVALSLDDYRENWKYNLGDAKLQRFLLKTPIYTQWDDHEVANNWYPGEILTADPFNGIEADYLAEISRQALFEYNPLRGSELFRKVQHGKHMELFLLDERSYRDANSLNRDPTGIEMLGEAQYEWLKQSLKESKATWKVISTHDPLSLVTGGEGDWDAWAQGDAAVLGREVQLRELLRFIKDEGITNVVYITADVHFAAAISYLSDRASGDQVDFEPFWEFVIGPVHAGVFGPNALDSSFGPSFEYVRGPATEGLPQNLPPPNLQTFGYAEVSEEGLFTVRIHDIDGAVLYEKILKPQH
ncbi:MAG: alkaline phosphatase D family protein [Chromatiales bacterium]|jgi:alkaline phosphatase D